MVTDVVGDYWKLFSGSLKYCPPTSSSGNISNFRKIISNRSSHLIIRNYLYTVTFISYRATVTV